MPIIRRSDCVPLPIVVRPVVAVVMRVGWRDVCAVWRMLPAMQHFLTSRRPENVAQLRAHIVKLCRALSEDMCRKDVTNARVRLQEVVRQNGGHIEHVLH